MLYMEDVTKLKPTLWRTCRVLVNEQRLRMLKLALENGGMLCVRDYAKILGMPDSIASIYLRQLNARGLLGVSRDRIKVFYNDAQNRSLPDSIALQNAFRDYFTSDPPSGWEIEVMTIARAFTHFNRLAILRRLSEGPALLEDLFDAMGVCVKSVYHHLGFLHAAGLLHEEREHRKPSRFSLVRPTHPIAAVMLRLALGDREVTYFNEGSGAALDRESRVVLRKIARAEGNPRQNWRECGPKRPKSKSMPQSVKKALAEDDE